MLDGRPTIAHCRISVEFNRGINMVNIVADMYFKYIAEFMPFVYLP